jgi:hypothetical protein
MSWLDSQINRLTTLKNMHRRILKEEYCLPGCMPSSLVQIYQPSGQSAVSIVHLTLRWWCVCPFKMSVNFYQITCHLMQKTAFLTVTFVRISYVTSHIDIKFCSKLNEYSIFHQHFYILMMCQLYLHTYYSLPSPITFKHLSYRELNYY